MKKMMLVLSLNLGTCWAMSQDNTANLEFIAPTFPNIEQPSCVKVELIKKDKVYDRWTSHEPEPLKFTYLVTIHKNCKGTLTLTSTYKSGTDHHLETIKKTIRILDGTLKEE